MTSTAAGLVALLADAEWRQDFLSEMANFPVGLHEDVCDAYIHGMKAFYAAGDFRSIHLKYLPGPLNTAEAERLEEMRMQAETAISPELDEIDNWSGPWG